MSMARIQSENASATYNGPICTTCGVGYVSSHQCDPAELRRQAMRLLQTADAIDAHNGSAPLRRASAPVVDRTAGCPCRPENGGSGICGCVLGGLRITC
jgi:hypothetical protein